MKTLKLTTLAALATLSTAYATPLKWTCDWPEARAQAFSLYQGETATFEPTFRVNGQIVTNAAIEAVWYQTNGMGNAWWKLDGATFAPSNDVGAAAYRFFVEAKTSDDILYRANGTLRMLPSPGFAPNAIEPPVKALDFAAVEYYNAPWPAEIASATNALAQASASAFMPASFTETDPAVPSWAKKSAFGAYNDDLYRWIAGDFHGRDAAIKTPYDICTTGATSKVTVGAAPGQGIYPHTELAKDRLQVYGDDFDHATQYRHDRIRLWPWWNEDAEDYVEYLYPTNRPGGTFAFLDDIPQCWDYAAITNAPWVASLAPATNYTDAVAAGLSIAIATNAAEITAVDARAEAGRVWVDWHDSVADNDQAAGYSTIYFKPSVFGMSDGAAIKSFTVKTSGNTGGLPSRAVYAKFINPDSTAAAMGVSRPVRLTSGNTVYKFEFDMAVAFATATKQYRLVFYSGAPDGSPQVNVALRLHLMASATDLYFGAGKTTWRPTMTVQWGGLIREEDPTVPSWAKVAEPPYLTEHQSLEPMTNYVDGVVAVMKPKQSAVLSPPASGSSTQFVATITQNENGVITVTRKNVQAASLSVAGITKLRDSAAQNDNSCAATPHAVYLARRDANAYTDTMLENGLEEVFWHLDPGGPANRSVLFYEVTNATTRLDVMPAAHGDRVIEFIVDVCNSYATNSAPAQASIDFSGLGGSWRAMVEAGEDLSDMTVLAPGERARFRFEQTAFTTAGKSVFMIAKQVLAEVPYTGPTYELEADGTVSTDGELNSDGTLTVDGELNDDGTLTVEAQLPETTTTTPTIAP